MSWNKIEFEETQKLGGNLGENMAQWSWTMDEFSNWYSILAGSNPASSIIVLLLW